MRLSENISRVEASISQACHRAGRLRTEVSLVAVSKRQPFSLIREAYDLGLRDFGENVAQELRDKASMAVAEGLFDIRWHFIGRLQTNKVKYVLKSADYLHSLDRVELLRALDKRLLEREFKCFVQVNVGAEKQKGGVCPENLEEFMALAREYSKLRICGLMVIPPNDGRAEKYYQELAKLRDSLEFTHLDGALEFLSMGMSGDFEAAIHCGATHIRVGSSIFGSREG